MSLIWLDNCRGDCEWHVWLWPEIAWGPCVLTDRQQVAHARGPDISAADSLKKPSGTSWHWFLLSAAILGLHTSLWPPRPKKPQSSPKTSNWTLEPSQTPTNQQNHNISMGEVLTCFYKSAWRDGAQGARTRLLIHRDVSEGPRREGVDVLLAVPPRGAKLETLLRRALTLPHTFIPGGDPHHHCRHLLLAGGRGRQGGMTGHDSH